MSSAPQATATASAASFPVFAFASLVLFVLKVGGIGNFATMSWWWVAAPMLFGFALYFTFLIIFILIVVLVAVFGK